MSSRLQAIEALRDFYRSGHLVAMELVGKAEMIADLKDDPASLPEMYAEVGYRAVEGKRWRGLRMVEDHNVSNWKVR